MQQETVHFDSAEGTPLTGVLDRPANRIPRGYVVFAHDSSGAGDVEAAISKALCGQGAGVLRMDVTGAGQGEGTLAGSDLAPAAAQLVAAARFLERDHAAPVILMGHATAGAAVLHAAPQVSSVRAIAIVDAVVDTSWQDTLRARDCGLLILHSAAAGVAAIGAALAAWASGYMDQVPADEAGIDYDEPVIARIGASGLRTEMEAGGLPLVADEPRRVGGTATGPTPYGYLSAALASCTAMTLRVYADHKKLDLRGVEVRVSHDKIHADDCEHCETRAGKIDHFRRALRLEGDLDAAQRQRLVEIANRCPVHRTLHAEIAIHTTLLDD